MATLKDFIEANTHLHNIDRKIFKQLWEIIENSEWVYLTKEMVVEWMGYKDTKSMMSNFYSNLSKKYEENVDYKEVDKTHELVKNITNAKGGSHNKKHYLITRKTLIILLCNAKTKASERYGEHFYEIQNLLVQYYKSQYLDYKNKLKEMLEHHIIKKYSQLQEIKYLDIKLSENNKIGLVYFINEENDLEYFKIGFTHNLPKRLELLQNANRRTLEVYKYVYCDNPCDIETLLHNKLKDTLVKGEWYNIDANTINTLVSLIENDLITL